MINRIWSGSSLLYLFLLPLAFLYGGISTLIRLSYQFGICKVKRFPLPIVIVGNLTSGGNGKTPVLLWLVNNLQKRGWKVAVISRGHGGQSTHYPLILTPMTRIDESGDEPMLIYQRTGVPVAVSPRRSDAVSALLQLLPLDVVVSDDGLQHYSLSRDIEWVVIDGIRRFGNGWWLPAGPMRERASRLKTVHGIIVNGGISYKNEVPMKLCPSPAVNLLSGEKSDLKSLPDIIAIAGIGYPDRFFTMLADCGITPIKTIPYADHQVYSLKMLSSLATDDQQLLMTEKDAVKCRAFAKKNWWYLPVDAIFPLDSGNALLDQVEKTIKCFQKK